jgi:hypothetical protein
MTEPGNVSNPDRNGRLGTPLTTPVAASPAKAPSTLAIPAVQAIPGRNAAGNMLALSPQRHSAQTLLPQSPAGKPALTAYQQAFQKQLESTPPPKITPNAKLDGPLEPLSKSNPPPALEIPWKGPAPKPTPAERQAYRQLDANRREHFAQELKQDPITSKALAPEGWAKLSPDQRMHVIERVAKIQGQVFRFTPAPMKINDKDQVKAEKNGQFGAYSDEKGPENGTIQVEKWVFGQKEAKGVLDTVIHEQFHAMQHQKNRDAHEGILPKVHPLSKRTQVWRHDGQHYHEAPDGKDPGDKKQTAYCGGAQEKYAWEAAGDMMLKLGYPPNKVDKCM